VFSLSVDLSSLIGCQRDFCFDCDLVLVVQRFSVLVFFSLFFVFELVIVRLVSNQSDNYQFERSTIKVTGS